MTSAREMYDREIRRMKQMRGDAQALRAFVRSRPAHAELLERASECHYAAMISLSKARSLRRRAGIRFDLGPVKQREMEDA